ncbi:MAG: ABC-F family ATP-binding cassette domain-containing protein [bacterium]
MIVYFNNLKKEYFSKVVFAGVRFKLPVEKSEKIGIVAKNGEGKTTLLRIIAGIENPDAGMIKIEPKRTKTFYVSVDMINEENGKNNDISVESFLLSINWKLFPLKNRLDELSLKLEDEDAFSEYSELVEVYEKSGGYLWEENVDKIMKKLNIHGKYLNQLSGGEKSKVILAAIQTIDADLILLDEPTNHLDIESLVELEDFIKADPRSYFIVSHDQKFLDNVVSKIIFIEHTKVKYYSGNYTSFKSQKDLELSQELQEYEENQKEIHRLDTLAKNIVLKSEEGQTIVAAGQFNVKGKKITNKQGRRLKVAPDKDKMSAHYFNQKLDSVMRTAKIVKRRMNRIDNHKKPKIDWGIKLDFENMADSPDIIINTKDLQYIYPESKQEFTFDDVIVLREEKVGLIGPNGVGKSTFAKIISGQITDYKGDIKIPESVNIGYYSQTHENLNLDKRVLEDFFDLERIEDYEIPVIKEARNFLHQMLFEGDMVKQKISDLSQGEKSKLSLAKIIYKNPNFLLLDEPTNHLDIPSKERLEKALKKYKGTVLVISHDRYFMESIGVGRYIKFQK